MFGKSVGKNRNRIAGLLLAAGLLLTMAAPTLAAEPSGETPPSAADRAYGSDPDLLQPGFFYTLSYAAPVDGRQGIASENGEFWVSGNKSLSHYDADWNLLQTNSTPLRDFGVKLNHIGDIDVYQGEIYACPENFDGSYGRDIQIAVYDADTLELRRTIPFCVWCGQLEASGIAVDPDTRSLWMSSWSADEGSEYLYRYNLDTGAYIGRIRMLPPPGRIQGIAYQDGFLYMTADNGAGGESDHIYRWRVDTGASYAYVTLERTMWEMKASAEIEGITFDKTTGRMLVSHNYRSEPDENGKTRELRVVYAYDRERNLYPLDYARAESWAALPDPKGEEREAVDVFLVLPGVNGEGGRPDNEDVASLPAADRFREALETEKSVLEETAEVYAPLYRQMNPAACALAETERRPYEDVAYGDVRDAFLYYLENRNDGRPFVLCGRDQGAEMVLRLLRDFGGEADFAGRMAACVRGVPITEEMLSEMPWLTMTEGEKDGVILIPTDSES